MKTTHILTLMPAILLLTGCGGTATTQNSKTSQLTDPQTNAITATAIEKNVNPQASSAALEVLSKANCMNRSMP